MEGEKVSELAFTIEILRAEEKREREEWADDLRRRTNVVEMSDRLSTVIVTF
jgi:hypothetical protein